MTKSARRPVLTGMAIVLLSTWWAGATPAMAGNLVTPQWLQSNLENPRLVLLDTSPAPAYAAKHIAGAIGVDFMVYGFPEPSLAEMEARYQAWGVSPGTTIVIYDQGGSMMATRLFFALYYHGFPASELMILDGGLARWEALGLPVTADPTPVPASGSFRITTVNHDARVKLPEFLEAAGDRANNVLLEALGANWHFGEVLAFDRAGHIPHAVMLPSADFYNPDKTFKSPEELTRMLAYLGVGPEKRIHTHCGGGVAASVPFFALKFILNYPRVTLYQESQMGWLSDDRGLPYWTYDAPYLMRETAWLQSWGGQMMRRYGGARVSIVDVRPAEAFAHGHVPFALNVPADVFRSHLRTPEKLPGLLAAAGVNAGHEAVVVSGAGLTKEAALAFAMLEHAGQKNVSIFLDSMEEWTALGYKLVTESAAAGPGGEYPHQRRDDVIVTHPAVTERHYPKVFVASGSSVPTDAYPGTVVHVPYTDLLKADGTPKAAKDVWSILTTAGVPRYAELVCVSEDDPGAAAVTYFVLKLMGFPDVKLLVRASS